MNFRRSLSNDEPEINFIPLIDILLVIVIFLAATTSFTRYQQLRVNLPEAQAEAIDPRAITLAISQDGLVALNRTLVTDRSTQGIAAALREATQGQRDPTLLINADAQATHQSVVNAMEAARLAGIRHVNFATQQ